MDNIFCSFEMFLQVLQIFFSPAKEKLKINKHLKICQWVCKNVVSPENSYFYEKKIFVTNTFS